MDPATFIAFGMFVIAAVTTTISLIRTKKIHDSQEREEAAELLRARTEMNLGSIEAAERVIAIYTVALTEAQERMQNLQKKIDLLEDEKNELEEVIHALKGKINNERT